MGKRKSSDQRQASLFSVEDEGKPVAKRSRAHSSYTEPPVPVEQQFAGDPVPGATFLIFNSQTGAVARARLLSHSALEVRFETGVPPVVTSAAISGGKVDNMPAWRIEPRLRSAVRKIHNPRATT